MSTPFPIPTPEQLAHELAQAMEAFWETVALLDPGEVETAQLADGWTPKAVVAHVAFWDDFQTRRMEAAYRGESAASGFARPQADNDTRAEEDDARGWDEVVADAQAARARLVAFARSLPPEALARVYPEGDRTLSLLGQLQHMVRHVRLHGRDLQLYCGSMQRWSRASLRGLLEQQHRDLLDSVAGLTEMAMQDTRVCGEWSIYDVLAHVLSWNELAVRLLAQWPAPDPVAIEPWSRREGETEAAQNARLLAARAGLDPIAVADGLATCHRKIMTAFDRFSDAELQSEGRMWEGQGVLSGFLYEIARHEAEHAAQIFAYRAGESRA